MSDNLRKALFVLLYDQFDSPDIELDDSESDLIDYIISALIEKNENRCPFKCYDCIGKCTENMIGCVEGLKLDCTREAEEVWREFIGNEE